MFYMQVIEYIRFLKEKLNMYEEPYQGWSSEPRKLTPWVITFDPIDKILALDFVYMNGNSHVIFPVLSNLLALLCCLLLFLIDFLLI